MDMKSHTGYFLTLGTGSPISGSQSQKINTRSSTESELVGVDDVISCGMDQHMGVDDVISCGMNQPILQVSSEDLFN